MKVNEIVDFCNKFSISVVFQGDDCGYYELLGHVDDKFNTHVKYADAELDCIVIKQHEFCQKQVKCCEW